MTFNPENLVFLVAGGLISLWLASRYRDRRQISFWNFGRSVFSSDTLDDVDGFEVKFKGQKVSYVSQHWIYIWNSGNKALWKSNFATETPLNFAFEPGSELIIDEIFHVSDGVQWNPEIDGCKFIPNFEVLDSGKGIALSILETRREKRGFQIIGPRWFPEPSIKGTVIDLISPPKRQSVPDPTESFSFFKFMFGCVSGVTVVAVVLVLFGFIAFSWPLSSGWKFGLALGASVVVGAFVASITSFLRARFAKVPIEFSKLGGGARWKNSPLVEATDEVAAAFREDKR